MGNFIDLTKQKFGRLTVLERAENSANGKVRWLCQCDCGNKKIVYSCHLKDGHTKSCGCLNRDMVIARNMEKSLIGQVFGDLTVLEDSGKRKQKNIIYKCQCSCGNIVEVAGGNLTSGNTKSCGCLKSQYIKNSYFNKENLVGQVFGRLTIIERTEKRHNRMVIYKCKCQCGNIIETASCYLKNGDTQSCGCLTSKGELKVSQILRDNNIPFEIQKTFEKCKNPNTNALFRFDFYVDNNYLIEYDGIQHFKEGFFNRENFSQRQEYDKMKNDYCRENNIPLIRIPYTKYDTLCIKDLLLETSEYII